MKDVVIVSGVRTAQGKFSGALKGFSAPPQTCDASYAGSIYYDSDNFTHCACNSTSWVMMYDYSTVCT